MILAYLLNAHDGHAFFFRDRKASIFCPSCGTLLDREFLPKNVRPRKKWDICTSYENRTIVTSRFKDWCEANRFEGLLFRQINESPPYFHFSPTIALRFDFARAHTRFINKCAICGNFESVIGTSPPGLLDVSEPIWDGFFRTDLEFGGRWEKSPLIVTGIRTKQLIEQERFRLVVFEPIEN